MNAEIIEQLEPIIKQLRSWKGIQVKVHESISRANNNHNRHLATSSIHMLVCDGADWAISGGRLRLLATEGCYEIAFDFVTHIEISETQIKINENLSTNIQRLTTFGIEKPNGHL
ncbi:MAG: hypothetical protein IPO40_10620 [Fibrobacteres bacterium]|nr:hypothetical protein [Fibrobacterota bacterium]